MNPRRTQEEPKKNPSDIHEKDILDFCREPRSAMEICAKFGFKSIKPFKKNHLKPLLDKKMLVMTIPDKPTSKNQKYIVNSDGEGNY